MRVAWVAFFGSLLFLSSADVNSQQISTTVQRDPQAIAIVQQSLTAITINIPADSSATGTVTVVEGSTTLAGTIQILTRGAGQTAETVTLPNSQRQVIYSSGDAKEVTAGQSVIPPLELAVTDQCPDFPLPFLLSSLSSPDVAFRYIGLETLNGTVVQHIQIWNTFASNSHLQQLAPFSMRDIWFDAQNRLPVKVAYVRRTGGIAQPSFAIELSFSSYANINGVLYPFQIKKSFNGTPWETIMIQSVAFNVGLTDAQFQVQ
jgi:hypothetical protein